MKTILFVDDEINILKSMRRLLSVSEHGFSCEFIEGGEKASEYLNENNCDVLISDLNMPGVNGLMLADKAKKINPDIKVIILSGDAGPELQQNKAVDSVMSKPCEINLILEKINWLLR